MLLLKKVCKISLIFLILLESLSSLKAQDYKDSLHKELIALYTKSDLPGFCLSVIREDSLIFQQGYGFSDKEQKIPYSRTTIQPIASISKTFIAISVMKAIELGYFTLETSINEVLPFRVQNPNFPNDTIRVKHLVTHTSSIIDKTSSYLKAYYLIENNDFNQKKYSVVERYFFRTIRKNHEIALGVYLKEVLSKGGEYYSNGNFSKNKVGQVYNYSNIGASLMAYIIEYMSNMSFDEFTRLHIFSPLMMDNTCWKAEYMDTCNQAVLYSKRGGILPKYSCTSYPDGNLRINSEDLSKFLSEIIKGYHGTGSLLNATSYKTMFVSQSNKKLENEQKNFELGVFWELKSNQWIGHNGSDPGVCTYMYFNPEKRMGLILITNIQCDESKNLMNQFHQIWKTGINYINQISIN